MPRATITPARIAITPQVATREAIIGKHLQDEVPGGRSPALRVLGLERIGPGR
jgi:hypothetical protein